MFTYKVMDSDLAIGLECALHKKQVEIRLTDTSELPLGERKIDPGHCVMAYQYLQFAERIRNLTVYEDDVWVVTFTKSGTTWTQEMVWLIDHDLDYVEARKIDITERSVFLEPSGIVDDHPLDTVRIVEHLARPRHIKTYLPLVLLPKQLWTVKPKIVYCARNPKDVAVSFMHHYRHLHGYDGSNEHFLEALLADQVLWCPLVKHALDFWNLRRLPHVLFIHYEEMKKDLMSVLKRASKFFDKTYSEEDFIKLAEHLSFDSMKKNPTANNTVLLQILESLSNRPINFEFMRRGEVGSYKDQLTPEYVQRWDRHIAQQLEGSDFKYME